MVWRMSDQTYSVTVEVSERQFKLGLRRYWMRIYGYRTIAIKVLLLLMSFLLWYVEAKTRLQVVVWITFAILTLNSVLAYSRFMGNSMHTWRKMEDRSITYEFRDNGVTTASELGRGEFKWRLFEKIWKYSDIWLLFVTRHQFYILPTKDCSPELHGYLDHWINIGSAGRPKCSKRGYDLRGQRETRCPECGT